MTLKHPLTKSVKITRADVGKIIVLSPDEESVQLLSREDFLELSLEKIGKWEEVSEFDVNV